MLRAKNIQSSNSPYSYRPLDVENSETRLLALNTAGKNTDELSGQLVHVSLDDEEAFGLKQFNALSYVWGEGERDRRIYIDGHLLMITKNLESALRHVREQIAPDRQGSSRVAAPRYWWIDQICIHQMDLEERSSQVSLMRRVYKKAAAVKIWLGDAIEGSSTAMEIVQKIGRPPTCGPGEKEIVYPCYSKEQISRHWDAMRLLFEMQWWRRCWIRQEAVLASFAVVSWGDSSCRLDTIYQAVMAMDCATTLGYRVPGLHKFSKPLRYDFYHHADDLRKLRKRSNDGRSFIPLPDLIIASRDCQATEPRDKVFSMLGLADPEVYDIRADYRLPLPEVLKIAARKILPLKDGLQVLGTCQNPERRHGLPSWVPNLIEQWRYHPFEPAPYDRSLHEPAIDFDGDTLLVQGFIFDNITDVFEVDVTTNATDEQLDVIYTEWQLLSHACPPSPPQERNPKRDRDEGWMNFLSVDAQAYCYMRWADDESPLPESEEDLRRRKYPDLNLRLVRSYLVPDDFQKGLHPVQKIRNALKKYGPGRRLGVYDFAKVVLLPADARKGDVIAFFKGSTFPCVLRKHSNEDYILVGEACFDSNMNAAVRATRNTWSGSSMIRII
ncbi:hypothetical protein LTR46_007974 [Exophiala xenobiotica]|nr:hypothetical protein LTR46_007974 [Exophiala xenobiotica]